MSVFFPTIFSTTLARIFGRWPLAMAVLVATAPSAAPGATHAHTHVTLNGYSQVTALGRPSRSQETLYLRKDRLRRDVTERGRSYTYLYDAKRQELIILDHLFRQAEIRRLEPAARKKPGRQSELRLELSPTGRGQELPPWRCLEHHLRASLPGRLGQEQVTVTLDGQVWLAPNTREQRLLEPLLKAIPAGDLLVGLPAPGQPATTQVQGLNEVLRRVLPKGMLCAFDLQVDYAGEGPMANLARRMATRVALMYERLEVTTLQDALFEIPAGYQVMRPFGQQP